MPLQTNSSRQRRLALGWSIEELAQRSGIPMHLLTRYEQGQYLPPAQRSKLARVYGCSTEDIPERDPWVVDTDTATTDISSLWERVIGQHLRQSVELSAVLRPGELVRGYLAVGDPTALVVQTERDWYLVPVPRVHWLRGGQARRPGTGWTGARTPTVWLGVLNEWVGQYTTLRLVTGEVIEGRLLNGDETAVLVDRAGSEHVIAASAICWISVRRKGAS